MDPMSDTVWHHGASGWPVGAHDALRIMRLPRYPLPSQRQTGPCDQIVGATRRKHARQFKESPQCLGLHLLHATFNDIVERDWGAVLRALTILKSVAFASDEAALMLVGSAVVAEQLDVDTRLVVWSARERLPD